MLACSCPVEFAKANQLIDMGPQWQSENAKVIVIATMESTGIPTKVGTHSAVAARFHIEAVLRGKVKGEAVLVPYLYSSEGNYACCDASKRYLLFLDDAPDGVSYPVNGKFGVYEISGHPPSPSAKAAESSSTK